MSDYGSTSFIIPIYITNQELADMTTTCINSLMTCRPDEIIVVNDGSPIPYKAQLGKQIDLETNSGYATAVNTALEVAQGDLLFIGNNDMVFDAKSITGLLRVFEEGYDIATCWTSDQKYKLEPVIKDGDKFGSYFAMKREVYENIGGFDTQFRGYFADTDYKLRIEKEGYRIGMNYNLVVHHDAKATYSLTDPEDEEFIRSHRLFEIKWGFVL